MLQSSTGMCSAACFWQHFAAHSAETVQYVYRFLLIYMCFAEGYVQQRAPADRQPEAASQLRPAASPQAPQPGPSSSMDIEAELESLEKQTKVATFGSPIAAICILQRRV